MTKTVSYFFWFFIFLSISAQEKYDFSVSVDTTKIRIGEQLNYNIELITDTLNLIQFEKTPFFSSFEIIDEKELETIRLKSKYKLRKQYSLIQFDSGSFIIPRQKVIIDNNIKFSDSISIYVSNVKVDTLKQKLYDIKPIAYVKKSYDKLIKGILLVSIIILIIIGILYTYFYKKRRKKLIDKEILPFDRAINELKLLEEEKPKLQTEFKNFYSKLTEIVRRYIEEEVKLDALESTSQELIAKLENLIDKGSLDLEKETVKNLKKVLENADLVKFAKSTPETNVAINDCKLVEVVVLETKEGLPEPTEEEMLKNQEYLESIAKKRRKEKTIWAFSLTLIAGLITLLSSIAIYGYYPVIDTLTGYPTKKLYSSKWFKSQYGVPPVIIETPEVLVRKESKDKTQTFEYGDFSKSIYISLEFDFFQSYINSNNNSSNDNNENEKGEQYIENIISNFESKGAVNILLKNEKISLKSGSSADKVFGTFDYPNSNETEMVRCNFTNLILVYERGTINLRIVYKKEDRYGSMIEEKIINSIELIKEL